MSDTRTPDWSRYDSNGDEEIITRFSQEDCYGFSPIFLIFRDMDDVLCRGY